MRSTPVVVNGTLRGPERDVFRVSGKAGERRVFEVEARRCGSAVDPVLRILDGAGKQLARSDDSAGAGLDARLDFTFPAEGNYYVEVTDARFSTQAQNFYRLKMGTYRYAEGIFPAGRPARQADAGDVLRRACRRGAQPTVDLGKAGPTRRFTRVSLPDSPALPFLFAIGDLPEVMEPVEGAVPVPAWSTAGSTRTGEVDRYRLKVEPGDKLLLEMQARELGTSKLEAHHHGLRCGGQEARFGGRPAAARGRFRDPGHQPHQQRSVPESDRAGGCARDRRSRWRTWRCAAGRCTATG